MSDINYAYADFLYRKIVLDAVELNMRGTFEYSGSYQYPDVVDYDGAKYVALTPIIGTAPEGNHSEFWSVIAAIREGAPPIEGGGVTPEIMAQIVGAQNTADSALGAARFAIDLASIGTNVGTNALNLAQHALEMAWYGTYLGNVALQTAWSGTAGVEQVFSIANSGTAGVNQVFPVANSGTAGVNQVFPIANSGTAGVNQVFPIAVAGTNLAQHAEALAEYGTYLGYLALQTAWSGTAGVNQVMSIAVAGTTIGLAALQAAWAGTNAAQQLAYPALVTAWAGTNTGNLALAQSYVALVTAWAGTATANAIQLTDAGSAADGWGLSTPRSGNNLPVKRITTGQNLESHASGSNVSLSITQISINSIQWTGPSYGQTTVLPSTSGTLLVDLAGPAYIEHSFAGSVFVAVQNVLPGRGVSVLFDDAGTNRGITFQTGLRFVGGKPDVLLATKLAMLSLTAFGSSAASVVAAYSAEQ